MVLIGMLDLKKDPRDISKSYGYAAVAKAEGIDFFYFTPKCINFEKRTINGHFFEKGEWTIKETRFPDVIYNSRSHAKTDDSQELIEKLRKEIPFTSFPVGNKLQVNKMLGQSSFFSQFLLPTMQVRNYSSFKTFLTNHQRVIVKPINGRKGQNIIYIETLGNANFKLIDDRSEQIINEADLKKYLKKLLQEKGYIAQKYNLCKTKNDEAYDFRIHVQKNGEGKWINTATYPRIGAIGSVKSNISTGGRTCNLEPFLTEEFADEYFNKKQELNKFGCNIASFMDGIYGVSFDELGIDVAYDANGKLVLYEINWHPGVPPVFYFEMDVAKNTIQYAKYLAEKRQKLKEGTKYNIIAVTGSYGKSTTKAMIASVLAQKLNVFESKDNCNTSVNTMLHAGQINELHDVSVLEYGMGHKGVITKHCSYIMPNYSVVTNIGNAHIVNFDQSIKKIAEAKSEIIHGMKPDGVLYLNADDENSKLLDRSSFHGKIVFVGIDQEADYRAENVRYTESGMEFELMIDGNEEKFSIPTFGKHNVYNALFAVAVCYTYGLSAREISRGLKTCRIPENRLTIHKLPKGIVLIDDTIHATVGGVKSALDVLSNADGKRKIAILGRIPQLGKDSRENLNEIGRYVAGLEIDYLITVGSNAKNLGVYAQENGFSKANIKHFYNKDNLKQFIKKQVKNDTVILIKGAKQQKMGEFVNDFYDFFTKNRGTNEFQ